MLLSAREQERYARHLLLEELGGAGQERLVASAAAVRLPLAASAVARWAVRYLAASGVGTIFAQGPWAAAAAAECALFAPGVVIRVDEPACASALVVGEGQASAVRLAQPFPDSAAEAGALGARAALEVLKQLLGVGSPAALPLSFAGRP